MANTKVISTRDLIGQESIQFIREQTLNLTLIEARPNTKMNVFFGDTDVTHLCYPKSTLWSASSVVAEGDIIKDTRNYYVVSTAGTLGTTPPSHTSGSASNGTATLAYAKTLDIITDSIGQAVIEFNLPGGTFNTGNYDVIVTDADNLSALSVNGSVAGSAKTIFSAKGTIEIYQPREITVTLVERPPPPAGDPLAQSFFTYGVEGGMFITSIDVYFQSKDPSIPVRMELRPMINGYPAPLDITNPALVATVAPADVQVSEDASLPTKFTFPAPVYVKGDGDYCFVLKSNSNAYNVYTSRLGEASFEDGRRIYEQPYTGSVFKSENNITWTAEQMEDLKFTIYKAQFDTNAVTTVSLDADLNSVTAYGDQFVTTSGSGVVRYTSVQDHGLEIGSKIDIVAYSDATYNGIDSSEFTGSFTVTSVVDRKTVEFEVGANATSSGPIETSNVVTNVAVLNEGINYSGTDTVVFTGGGGSNAAAELVVVNGNIKKVVLTNKGTGYTSAPTVSITTSTGTGVSLLSSVTAAFNVITNKPMTGFKTSIGVYNFGDTQTVNTLTTTLGNYEGGNLTTYGAGKGMVFEPNYSYANIGQNSLIASKSNEEAHMSGNKSSSINIQLSTTNPNLSPVVNLKEQATLTAFHSSINNQSGETVESTNSSGSIDSIVITGAGTGYTSAPTITISAPDLETGVQATATVTIDGGSIDEVTIVEAGSGYLSTPLVTVTNASGDTTGANGALQAVLTAFNSELLPTGGSAKARYLTKKTTLQLVSTGIRLISAISSIPGGSVDWYIRTSLSSSSVTHESQSWQRLSCDVSRDKSSYLGEVYEYEFKLDDIAGFDTYDLKCVLTAQDPTKAPVVNSYRVIVIA